MARGRRRGAQAVLGVMLAIGLVGVVPAAAAGTVPERHQRASWQHACEHLAGGTLSDQPALVCNHLGEPAWTPKQVDHLARFCVHALGGQPVFRSQYPLELVGCFF